MSATTAGKTTSQRKWSDIFLLLFCAALFVWLREYSGWWQNRWVGFVLGGVFAIALFLQPRPQQTRYKVPKLVFLLLFAVFLIMGVKMLRHFFLGGTSDDGLFALALLAPAIYGANIYYRLSKNETGRASEDQQD